jgi:hypothetical protein
MKSGALMRHLTHQSELSLHTFVKESMSQTTLPPLGSSSSSTAIPFVRLLPSVGEFAFQSLGALVIIGLLLFDALAATVSLAAGIWIASTFWQVEPSFTPYVPFLPALLLVRILTLRHYGLYRLRGAFRYSDDLLGAFKGVSLGCIYGFVALLFFHRDILDQPLFLSRVVFVCDWVIMLFLVITSRIVLRQVQSWARSRGHGLIRHLWWGLGKKPASALRKSTSPHAGLQGAWCPHDG